MNQAMMRPPMRGYPGAGRPGVSVGQQQVYPISNAGGYPLSVVEMGPNYLPAPPVAYGYPAPMPQGYQPMAPNCPPVFYPLNNTCDELTLAPVNPCDPFSLFCSLFGRRRGLKKTTIGIPLTEIPANSSATISIPVGIFFRPCSLRIPSDIINAGLAIASILSGTSPQIQGPVPARLFSEVAIERITLAGDPVGFGNSLTMVVTNSTGSTINFQGAFFGTEFDC